MCSKQKSARRRKASSAAKAGHAARRATAARAAVAAEPEAAAAAPLLATLTLPAQCTLGEASALKSALLPLVADARVVTIDASAVAKLDTSALQLFTAFARDRRSANRPLRWTGFAGPLATAAATLALAATLHTESTTGQETA
jgi:anti-anti-sigma regulatory factor